MTRKPLTKPEPLRKKRIWTTGEVARAIGWRTERVMRILKKARALFRPEGTHKWLVSESSLRRAMPEIFEEIEAERDAETGWLDPDA